MSECDASCVCSTENKIACPTLAINKIAKYRHAKNNNLTPKKTETMKYDGNNYRITAKYSRSKNRQY